MSTERAFAYRGLGPDGRRRQAVLTAPDRRAAVLRLQEQGVTVTAIEERDAVATGAPVRRRERADDRLLVLHQLAVLTRSGIPLLEAVQSIAAALTGTALAARLSAAATALRRGDAIAPTLEAVFPQAPAHVHALVRVGEANGNLAQVLDEAVRQMRFQAALRRDLVNALVYPAFLLTMAALAVAFLFVVVVPRFSVLLGPARDNLTGLSRAVLDAGMLVHDHSAVFAAMAAAIVSTGVWFARSRPVQMAALSALSRWPIVGGRIDAMQRAEWARVMTFAVSSGVGILDAATLAEDAVPQGAFKDRLVGSKAALRRGEAIADAFGGAGAIDAIDASLLRTGQRAGRLGEMFGLVADRNEEQLRAELKRTMAVLEQVAIAGVAIAVGVVVLGLVGAMTSMYEVIG